MYTVSAVVEMGDAHELILSSIKDELTTDDASPQTMSAEEYFEE